MKGLFKLLAFILAALGLSSKVSSKRKEKVKKIDTKRKDKDTQEYNYDEMPVFSENTTKNPDVKSPFL